MISEEYINYSRGGTKTYVNKEDTLLATELNNRLHFSFNENSITPGLMRTVFMVQEEL